MLKVPPSALWGLADNSSWDGNKHTSSAYAQDMMKPRRYRQFSWMWSCGKKERSFCKDSTWVLLLVSCMMACNVCMPIISEESLCVYIYDIWDWIETVGKFWIEEQSLISLVEFFLAWTSFHLSPWIVWTAVAQLYWIGNEKTERKLWKDGGEEILYNLFIYCVSNHSFIYSVKHNQIDLIKLLLDGANYGGGEYLIFLVRMIWDPVYMVKDGFKNPLNDAHVL